MSEAYAKLKEVLDMAYDQASNGKGKERHAKKDEPFENQKICEITRRVGHGFPLGQAIKKAEEAPRLGTQRGIAEKLGAIVYLAASIMVDMEEDVAEEESIPTKHFWEDKEVDTETAEALLTAEKQRKDLHERFCDPGRPIGAVGISWQMRYARARANHEALCSTPFMTFRQFKGGCS